MTDSERIAALEQQVAELSAKLEKLIVVTQMEHAFKKYTPDFPSGSSAFRDKFGKLWLKQNNEWVQQPEPASPAAA